MLSILNSASRTQRRPSRSIALPSDGSQPSFPHPLKYWQLQTSQTDRHLGLPGGIVESKTGESRVSLTIQVESMDEACAKVSSLGGQLVTDRRFVPGYGVHVLCKDPQGCFFALIEPPKGA